MATQKSYNDTPEHLKCQTWVLKVSIHCEGCKKKVYKLLHNIDGVFTVSIDSQQHKVSVTGNVEAEKLIKKLAKAGKHAEILQEKVEAGESENKTGKSKKNKKKKKNNPDSVEKDTGVDDENQEGKKEKKHDEIKALESSDENGNGDEKPNSTESSGKKKKKKGKKENKAEGAEAKDALGITESFPAAVETIDPPIGMMHLGPPYGHVYSYYPPQPFGLSYSTSHPTGISSYYASPAFAYNNRYTGYRQPPPSAQIRAYNNYDHDGIYVENDGESGCSIM